MTPGLECEFVKLSRINVRPCFACKLCATVITHLTEDVGESVRQSLATQLGEMEHMELVGQVMIKGNLPCFTCGVGDECEMSGI